MNTTATRPLPSRRFGEPWTQASWLQALGFGLLVAGTALYAQAGLPHSGHSSADPMAQGQAAAHTGSGTDGADALLGSFEERTRA